jgi:hypothetical protein
MEGSTPAIDHIYILSYLDQEMGLRIYNDYFLI